MPKTSFMNKNVNLILLLLVVAVISIIALGTVYFQDEFYELTGNYNIKTTQLENTSSELQQCKDIYQQTVTKLNQTLDLTVKEKSDLRKVYTVTKTELETDIKDINSSLESTKHELLITANQLFDTTNRLNDANAQITVLGSEKKILERRVNSLRSNVDTLESQIASLQSELTACQGG